MKQYSIPEKDLAAVISRDAIKTMVIMAAVFGGFVLLMLMLLPPGAYYILLFMAAVFTFIGIVIYFIRREQRFNAFASTVFQIAEDHFAKGVNSQMLNGVNKFGMGLSEMRYGAQENQFIRLEDLDTIIINRNDIIISSRQYDFFNGNGRIVIPKEVEGFDEIKAMLLADRKKYRLIEAGQR